MRGAYYVAVALLIEASSRTAANSGQSTQLQTYDHDVVAAGSAVNTTLPTGSLRMSHDTHKDLVPSAANEERTAPSLLSRIDAIGATISSLTDDEKILEALRTVLMEASEKAGLNPLLNPHGDTAATVDPSQVKNINIWIELMTEKCAKKIRWKSLNTSRGQKDLTPLSKPMKRRSRTSEHDHIRVFLPTARRPVSRYLPKDDISKFKAVHDAFSDLCSPLYKPTEKETELIWSMMNYVDINHARYHAKLKVKYHAIEQLKTVLVGTLMQSLWKQLTSPQHVEIVNDFLTGHLQRLKWMTEMFEQAYPDFYNTILQPEGHLSNIGKHAQPNLDVNIDESSDLTPLVRKGLQNPHMIKPTSSKLTTKDFLANFEKSTLPSLDFNIGESSTMALPVHGGLQKPHLIEPIVSESTAKDLLANFSQTTLP